MAEASRRPDHAVRLFSGFVLYPNGAWDRSFITVTFTWQNLFSAVGH